MVAEALMTIQGKRIEQYADCARSQRDDKGSLTGMTAAQYGKEVKQLGSAL